MSQTDLIIGMASSYGWEDLEPFAVSLSRSGFKGECVLIIGEGPKDEVPRYGPLPKAREDRTLEQMLGKYGIKVWDVGKFEEHPSIARAYFISTYLCAHTYRYVLCVDTKDLVFQKNPMIWMEENLRDKELVVVSEMQRYGQGEMVGNNKNMIEAFGEEEYQKLKGQEIVNGGVFGGKTDMVKLICYFINQMSLQDKRGPVGYAQMLPDQSALNILIREPEFKDKVLITWPHEGFVFGHPLRRYSTFKDDGKMYPIESTEPFYIFHQYFDSEIWWKAVRSLYHA